MEFPWHLRGVLVNTRQAFSFIGSWKASHFGISWSELWVAIVSLGLGGIPACRNLVEVDVDGCENGTEITDRDPPCWGTVVLPNAASWPCDDGRSELEMTTVLAPMRCSVFMHSSASASLSIFWPVSSLRPRQTNKPRHSFIEYKQNDRSLLEWIRFSWVLLLGFLPSGVPTCLFVFEGPLRSWQVYVFEFT